MSSMQVYQQPGSSHCHAAAVATIFRACPEIAALLAQLGRQGMLLPTRHNAFSNVPQAFGVSFTIDSWRNPAAPMQTHRDNANASCGRTAFRGSRGSQLAMQRACLRSMLMIRHGSHLPLLSCPGTYEPRKAHCQRPDGSSGTTRGRAARRACAQRASVRGRPSVQDGGGTS